MKRIILAVCLFLCIAAVAIAADVKLAWDAPDPGSGWTAATKVRIYEIVGTERLLKGEALGSALEITLSDVTPGAHTYVARAYDVWESDDSNSVTTPGIPAAPSNLKFSITITMTIP